VEVAGRRSIGITPAGEAPCRIPRLLLPLYAVYLLTLRAVARLEGARAERVFQLELQYQAKCVFNRREVLGSKLSHATVQSLLANRPNLVYHSDSGPAAQTTGTSSGGAA
jgi:hypothetical protein